MSPLKDIPELPHGRFSRLYDELTGYRSSVAEGKTKNGAERTQLQEKIVRCLWFDQFLDAESLKVEDGRRLAVFSPGYWNEGAGPDFRNAEFAFGDEARARGDVEVHVAASHWNQHGHADDSAYSRVLLHVVLHNDLGKPTVAHKDRKIPQLVLERHLSADLDEILKSLDPDAYPRVGCGREAACCRSIRALGRDERWVGRFLDIAGDERMLRKAERFAALIERGTPDDAMYEALMEAMGYSANRRPFRLLASAVPLDRLRRFVPVDADPEGRLLAVQALLFGAGGFLESEIGEPAPAAKSADRDTLEYLSALKQRWGAACVARPAGWRAAETAIGLLRRGPPQAAGPRGRRSQAGRRLNRLPWVTRRTRPTNHPARRIAGISAFLSAHLHTGLCRSLISAVEEIPTGGPEAKRCKDILERFRALLEEPRQRYWQRRTAFGAERLPRPTALIGPTRTTEMIVNVVIPLLLALSRRGEQPRIEQRLHNVYCSLRPLSDNAVSRYMKKHIFESEKAADRVACSARRQQGLIQIFHDYCESSVATCEACGLLAAVEGWAEGKA